MPPELAISGNGPKLAISVDGPTASGKSTLADTLAARWDMQVLDTGLTYRAVAYVLSRTPVPPGAHLFEVLRHDPAVPGTRPGRPAVVYHGEDIIDAIWSSEVEQQLRTVSTDHAWRREITAYHHVLVSRRERVVAVGRDCATTIMTNADCHVFLDAAEPVRRERRRAQYRYRPGRVAHVGAPTSLDDATCAYVSRQPRGLVLDTTFLPRHATARAVVHHLGDDR